jgi:flagellar protein FlaG
VSVDTAQITDTAPTTAAPQPVESAVSSKPVAKPTTAQLQGVVDDINRTMKSMNKNLEFSVDKESNRTVVKMLDSETGEVIRQFPSEEALGIAQSIEQMRQGMLLKQKA